MSVQLPPDSTGRKVAAVVIAGEEYQLICCVDPVDPTRRQLVDAQGGAMIRGEAASGTAVAGNPVLTAGQDGTNATTFKTQSAANVSAAQQNGAQVVSREGNWGQAHTPIVATVATTTKAAGGAGVRHVCTGIAFSMAVGTTAQTAIQVSLRDGATGAGNILWSMTIVKLASEPMTAFGLTGLSIPGTAATAMTLEFSAAGVTNSFQSVSLTGYDVS